MVNLFIKKDCHHCQKFESLAIYQNLQLMRNYHWVSMLSWHWYLEDARGVNCMLVKLKAGSWSCLEIVKLTGLDTDCSCWHCSKWSSNHFHWCWNWKYSEVSTAALESAIRAKGGHLTSWISLSDIFLGCSWETLLFLGGRFRCGVSLGSKVFKGLSHVIVICHNCYWCSCYLLKLL